MVVLKLIGEIEKGTEGKIRVNKLYGADTELRHLRMLESGHIDLAREGKLEAICDEYGIVAKTEQ